MAYGTAQLLVGGVGESIDAELGSAVVFFDNPSFSVNVRESLEVVGCLVD